MAKCRNGYRSAFQCVDRAVCQTAVPDSADAALPHRAGRATDPMTAAKKRRHRPICFRQLLDASQYPASLARLGQFIKLVVRRLSYPMALALLVQNRTVCLLLLDSACNSAHAAAPEALKVRLTLSPCPSLPSRKSPLCSFMTAFASDRPRPEPGAVRLFSKTHKPFGHTFAVCVRNSGSIVGNW